MDPKSGKRPGGASRWAMSWAFVAIVLVLHWAAPGALHLRLAANGTTSTFSSGERSARSAIAPRDALRIVGIQTDLPKNGHHGRSRPGGQPGALLPSALFVPTPGGRPETPVASEATLLTSPPRVFDPRAPPSSMTT